jgi:hypothetical protein
MRCQGFQGDGSPTIKSKSTAKTRTLIAIKTAKIQITIKEDKSHCGKFNPIDYSAAQTKTVTTANTMPDKSSRNLRGRPLLEIYNFKKKKQLGNLLTCVGGLFG